MNTQHRVKLFQFFSLEEYTWGYFVCEKTWLLLDHWHAEVNVALSELSVEGAGKHVSQILKL